MRISVTMLILFLILYNCYYALIVIAQEDIVVDVHNVTEENYLQSLLTTIEQLLNQGRTIDALKVIYSLSNDDKMDHEVRVSLARAYVQSKKIKEAEELLLDVISFPDAPVIAYMTLSRLYIQLQRWDEAQSYLEYIISSDPNHYQALTFLSKVWLNRDHDVLKAKTYIEKAYQIQPNDERVLFDYGMVLFQNKEDIQAKAALDQAEVLNPNIDHKMIGNVYLYYQHIDWAVPHFEKALFKTPSPVTISSVDSDSNVGSPILDAEVAVILADCKDHLGDAEKAYQLYNLVLNVQPNHALAHAGIGMMLLGTGNRNYASINACGLNQNEAVDHLLSALQAKSDLSLAQAALDFCQLESSQVRIWRDVVVAHRNIVDQEQIASKKQKNNLLSTTSQQLYKALMPIAIKLCAWWETNISNNIKEHVLLLSKIDQAMKLYICKRKNVFTGDLNNSNQQNHAVHRMKHNWELREKRYEHKALQGIVLTEQLLTSSDTRTLLTSSDTRTSGSYEMTGDAFIHSFMLKNKPALILNFQDSWGNHIHSELSDKTHPSFTLQSLLKEFGDMIVRVSVSETGRFDGPESGVLWGLSATDDVLVRPPATSMLFKDFLYLVKSNTKEYLALHQYLGQSFLDLIPLPESIVRSGLNKLEHLVTNLWIGGKPTTSPLHYDDYENFLCQIAGHKELILYPPADLDNLYYIGRVKGTLKYEYPGVFIRDVNSIDRNHYVFGSSVNIDLVDDKKFPKYHKATAIRVVLHPGQVLYLPAYWHHEVQSLPDSSDGLNIAVNFWFRNMTYPINDISILGIQA